MITQEYLQKLLSYNPTTGQFFWNFTRGRILAGNMAGHKRKQCIDIRIDKKAYRAHRLAWLYMYGEFPTMEIDHINRDVYDNRIANLRLATRHGQERNKAMRKRNRKYNLPKGVFPRYGGKFESNIDGEYLGLYDTPEEAHEVYKKHAKNRHGDFLIAEWK